MNQDATLRAINTLIGIKYEFIFLIQLLDQAMY